MAALSPMIKALLFVSVIILCMLGFTYHYLYINNPTSPVLSNPVINGTFANLNSTLSGLEGQTSQLYDAANNNTSASSISPFLIIDIALSAPFRIFNMVRSLFTTFSSFIFTQLFGGTVFGILSSVFLAGFIITAIFLIVKYVRTGESER